MSRLVIVSRDVFGCDKHNTNDLEWEDAIAKNTRLKTPLTHNNQSCKHVSHLFSFPCVNTELIHNINP